jgi:hypothetical protein
MRRVAPFFLLILGCADEPVSRSEHKAKDDEAPPSAASPKSGGGRKDSAAEATAVPAPRPETDSPGGGGDKAAKRKVRLAIVGGLGGSLTQAQVEQTIDGARDALYACYGNAEARIELALQIGATGEVSEVAIRKSEPATPKSSECAQLALEKLKFPAPRSTVKLDLAIYLESRG